MSISNKKSRYQAGFLLVSFFIYKKKLKSGKRINWVKLLSICFYQTAKLVPQPQVLLALGLLKVKPLAFNPPSQFTSIPYK